MNKGFFMVFLGIIVGAMALIFFNQASQPTAVTAPGRTVAEAAPATPSPSPVPTGPPASAARQRESVRPVPEAAKPAPEVGKPEAVRPEAVSPEQPGTEQAKPEQPKPERPKPDPDKPAHTAQTAAPAKPEPAAAPAQAASSPARPSQAAAPAQTTKPETPAQTAQTASAPVSARPETRVNPEKPRKSLTLRNIGLHTKNNGVALRIEADGPFSYKTFALPTPDRYVVDLVGTWSDMRAPKVPANMLVKNARVGSQSGGPRLVLDLQRAPRKHDVVWISPTVLEIRLE